MEEAAHTAASAAGNVASSGILGSLVVLLVVVCGVLVWRLEIAQAARVADAQKVAKDSLDREEKWQSVLGELTSVVERLADRASERPVAPRR